MCFFLKPYIIFLLIILISCSKEEYNEGLKPFVNNTVLPDMEYQQQYSSEFTEQNIDTTVWITQFDNWEGRIPSWFSKNNVYIEKGNLVIELKKEKPEEMPVEFDYTTGVLRSKSKFLYGFFEVRAKCMNSAGSSSFFLSDMTAEQWSEIDVFEVGGNAINHTNILHTCLHEFYNAENVVTPFQYNANTHFADGFDYTTENKIADDFHIFGLSWTQDSIIWYYDGEPIRSEQNTRWHQNLILTLDCEIMLDWFGLPLDEDLPSKYYIDYIRIFN